MAKMTFDTTGVDVTTPTGFEPYEGPVPKPGVYNATIKSVKMKKSQKSGNWYFKVLYIIGPDSSAEKNKCKGCPVFENVVPGESEFQQKRVGQLLKALTGRQKAAVDFDEETGEIKTLAGKPVQKDVKVRITVSRENYNDEPQPRAGDVFPFPKDMSWPEGPDASADEPEDEEVPEDDEELEEDDVEEEDVEEDEDEEAEEDEEEVDEYEARKAELEELDRAALKKILKDELESDFKVTKSKTDDDLRTAILAAEFDEAEEDEEEEGEDPF